MKLWWHLLAPAAVLMALGVIDFNMKERHSDPGIGAVVQLINYVMIASPYFVWFIASKVAKKSPHAIHSGFIGAHIALLAIAIPMYRAHVPEAANLWMLYFPLTIVTIPLCAKIGQWIFNKDGAKHA